MLHRIWASLLNQLERVGIWRTTYRGKHLTNLPEKLKRRVVYLVGEGGYDWSAAMLCPGGCGKVLEMNLLPDAKPVWQVIEAANGSISLYPSVWLKTGCSCHFILKNGRVRWA